MLPRCHHHAVAEHVAKHVGDGGEGGYMVP